MKKHPYNRRELFQLLGGSALLLHPILSSREAYAQMGVKKRYLGFLTSSGVMQDQFWPKGDSNAYDFTGTTLAPLAAFKNDLTILKGLRNDHGPYDSHSGGTVSLFTGNHLNKAACATSSCDYTMGDVIAQGGSIDQLYADFINGQTSMHSLVMAILPTRERPSKYISFDANGKIVPQATNPYTVFNKLFKDLTASCSGATAGQITPAMLKLRRKSILDAIKGDLASAVKHAGLNAEEKAKLESYTSGIRDIEKTLDSVTVPTDSACNTLSKFIKEPAIEVKAENYAKVARLMMDLIVAAFQLDITRSSTLLWSVGGVDGVPSYWANFNGKPIGESYHALTHQQADPQNWREKCKILDIWHAGEYAYLLGKLKDIKDGDSNLLDNTIAVWSSEIGEGSSHTNENIPFVLAGSAGKAIKTGRYLQVPKTDHYGLLIDIMQALGMKNSKIGRSGDNPKRFLA